MRGCQVTPGQTKLLRRLMPTVTQWLEADSGVHFFTKHTRVAIGMSALLPKADIALFDYVIESTSKRPTWPWHSAHSSLAQLWSRLSSLGLSTRPASMQQSQ